MTMVLLLAEFVALRLGCLSFLNRPIVLRYTYAYTEKRFLLAVVYSNWVEA